MLTLAITAAVILWMISGTVFSPEPQPTAVEPATPKPPKVRVQISEARPMTNHLTLQGQTLADRTVTVKAETHGVVKQTLVDKGAQVNTGDTLVKMAIDDRQARLLEARSLQMERKTEYLAVQSLKKSGYQAETELARAKAALDAAKASVRVAELELERTTIHAPITGIVDIRYVEVGDFVSRGDPVAALVDLDPIRVVAQVSERYLGRIKVDKSGEVRLLDGSTVPAQVTYVGSSASKSTRTFAVEMQIPNPDGLIIEGITAELHLPIAQIRAHNVPSSVLSLLDNGELSVKAVDANNQIIAYSVEVLGDSSDGIWLGGLPEKITLVVVGHEFVQPHQTVTPLFMDSPPLDESEPGNPKPGKKKPEKPEPGETLSSQSQPGQ
jgi:multidrug efflux system membrane fusion protein